MGYFSKGERIKYFVFLDISKKILYNENDIVFRVLEISF